MRVKVIPEFDVKTIIDETIGKDWKRFQANAFEMGKKLRRYMQTYINSHRHRSGGKGALAEAINFDYKLTTGSIFWGIGEVEELNARAKYWYVVNYGTYYGSSERFIPGKKKGGAPKFVPGRFGAGFGHPPNSSLKGNGTESFTKNSEWNSGMFPGVIRPINYIEASKSKFNRDINGLLARMKR